MGRPANGRRCFASECLRDQEHHSVWPQLRRASRRQEMSSLVRKIRAIEGHDESLLAYLQIPDRWRELANGAKRFIVSAQGVSNRNLPTTSRLISSGKDFFGFRPWSVFGRQKWSIFGRQEQARWYSKHHGAAKVSDDVISFDVTRSKPAQQAPTIGLLARGSSNEVVGQ